MAAIVAAAEADKFGIVKLHSIAEGMGIMPRGDGTGPAGQRPGRGRRMGRGQGRGRGRMSGPFAAGPGGSCVCPNCGASITHVAGQPCNATSCPKCGTKMTRG